jgi:hypothetical protein
MSAKQFNDLEFPLDVARGHRLVLVSFFDGFADMAEKMRRGQFYRLRNLGMFCNRWGNLEGSVKVSKNLEIETKDVQLLGSDAGHDEDFKAFLKCVTLQ